MRQVLRDEVVWQDPGRLSGTPCFTGTRVPVPALFDYVVAGDSLSELLSDVPGVTKEQVLGAIRLGKDQLGFGIEERLR